MSINKAAWIKERKGLIEVDTAETWVPGHGELLVRVEAASFNPADAKTQRLDMFQLKYPLIAGFNFAGTVHSTGPGVDSVKAGDRVAVARWGDANGDNRFGALQKYALAKEEFTVKLEPETTLEDASGLIAILGTVVAALNIYLGLAKPPVTGTAPPNGKRIFVYGGSSGVGGLAVKYASDAGYEVVTTSSPANKKLVEARNPSHIIDHTQPTKDVIREINAHGPYEVIFEAIGSQASTQLIAELLQETGGEFFSSCPSPGDDLLPANVKKTWAGYSKVLVLEEHRELREWYLKTYLPAVLKTRAAWPNPALWLKGGLNSTQEALDLLYEGKVSGKKLLINPQD